MLIQMVDSVIQLHLGLESNSPHFTYFFAYTLAKKKNNLESKHWIVASKDFLLVPKLEILLVLSCNIIFLPLFPSVSYCTSGCLSPLIFSSRLLFIHGCETVETLSLAEQFSHSPHYVWTTCGDMDDLEFQIWVSVLESIRETVFLSSPIAMVKASRCRSNGDTATGIRFSGDTPLTGLHERSGVLGLSPTQLSGFFFVVVVFVYFLFCFIVFVLVLIYMQMILFVKKKKKKSNCNYNIKPTILFCFYRDRWQTKGFAPSESFKFETFQEYVMNSFGVNPYEAFALASRGVFACGW